MTYIKMVYKWEINNNGEGIGTKRISLLLIILLISVTMLSCLSSEDDKKEDREADGSSGGSQRPREIRTPEGVQGKTRTLEETGNEAET